MLWIGVLCGMQLVFGATDEEIGKCTSSSVCSFLLLSVPVIFFPYSNCREVVGFLREDILKYCLLL